MATDPHLRCPVCRTGHAIIHVGSHMPPAVQWICQNKACQLNGDWVQTKAEARAECFDPIAPIAGEITADDIFHAAIQMFVHGEGRTEMPMCIRGAIEARDGTITILKEMTDETD